ncbi:GSCOCG00003517001-RA-CDS, partial [Cotesia congregata]
MSIVHKIQGHFLIMYRKIEHFRMQSKYFIINLLSARKLDFLGYPSAIISHTSGHPTFWSWVVYYFSCSPAESTQPRGRGFAKPRRSR